MEVKATMVVECRQLHLQIRKEGKGRRGEEFLNHHNSSYSMLNLVADPDCIVLNIEKLLERQTSSIAQCYNTIAIMQGVPPSPPPTMAFNKLGYLLPNHVLSTISRDFLGTFSCREKGKLLPSRAVFKCSRFPSLHNSR